MHHRHTLLHFQNQMPSSVKLISSSHFHDVVDAADDGLGTGDEMASNRKWPRRTDGCACWRTWPAPPRPSWSRSRNKSQLTQSKGWGEGMTLSCRSFRQIFKCNLPQPAMMCSPASATSQRTMESLLPSFFRLSANWGRSALFLTLTATRTTGDTANFMVLMQHAVSQVVT